MNVRPLSRDEVRSIDAASAEEFGLPTLVLMENAGRGAAERLRDRLKVGARVHVLCGPGNNGGDGAVVARHLEVWGFDVVVAWFAPPDRLRGDAGTQAAILAKSGTPQTIVNDENQLAALFQDADWVVDALFGTGLTRPVEGLFARTIDGLNRSGRPVLALDLPSGLDADTGLPLGNAVRATLTTTFVAPKLGFAKAAEYVGEVEVVEIGAPKRLLDRFQSRR